MTEPVTKASLSLSRRRLVELMQEINFGQIEGLVIHDGEPVFEPSPHVTHEIRFEGENGPRYERRIRDFALKSRVIRLFKELEQLGDGKVDSLEIKQGLPFRMKVRTLAGA